MSEYLDAVHEELEAGTVSARALVLLFRAGEEAEERHDIEGLEQTLQLARRIARGAGEALEAEAERLIALCEERLERARGGVAASAEGPGTSACPGCGRPLPEPAVRCRACGTLLV
jgi:hypothetical protein